VVTGEAACSCGQLRVKVDGEPVRLSVCHCLACQRRSGSAFAVQARFRADDVRIEGEHKEFVRMSDGGERRSFSFCPHCGGTVFYETENASDTVAVPVGAFADPSFPAPIVSVWEKRRHAWVDLPGVPAENRHQDYD
jgi:hypothetical protein